MRIHEFIIIPGAGHQGPNVYDRGHAVGRLAEVDLVDKVVSTICEELDNSLIRYRLINTRKAPGTPLANRYDAALPHCMPVSVRIGKIAGRSIANNFSTVFAHSDVPHALGREIAECLRHWGGLYVHGHRCSEPAAQDEPGLTIFPFQINGNNAEDYAQHLTKLGRDLGRVLTDFTKSRGDDAAIKGQSGTMKKALSGK